MSQPVSTLKLQINLSDENWVDPVAAKRLYRGSPYALLLTFVKNNQTIEAGSDVAFVILDHSTGDQVIAINGTQTDAKGESRVDIAEGQIDFDGDYQAIISINNSKAADFPLTIDGIGSPVPPPATVIDWSAYSGYANTESSGPYLFAGDGQTTSEDAQGRVTVNIPDGGAGKADQQDLTDHINDDDNPHQVTAAQVGADPAGSAAGVQGNLDTHTSATTGVHGIADTDDLILEGDARLKDARVPKGGAGGVLSGEYPNPGFAVNMATQQELDNAIATRLPLAGGTMSGDINMGDNSLTNVHSVVFEPDGAAPTKGLLAFDDERQSLKYYDEDLNLILVGENVVIRVRNVEGATINKGQVVFISGATGGNVEVKLAGAAMPGVNCCIGVILSDSINNNASGKMVTTGRLAGIDTSGFSEGQTIWLSDTPGEFTATPPALPSRRIRVGVVARVHQTEGVIQVSSVRNYDAEIDEKADAADVVKLTGDQTVGGVKTIFSLVSSSITPTEDSTRFLGNAAFKWGTAFINTVFSNILRARPGQDLEIKSNDTMTQATVKTTGVALDTQTASRPLYLDANKIIQTPTAEQFRDDIGAIDDAPEDGKQYAREDGAWTEVEAVATAEFIDVTMDSNQSVTPADGATIRATLEGNHTLTLNDPAETGQPHRITLRIAQDSTGDHTLTLAGNVHLAGGLQINVTASAESVTIYRLEWTGAAWSEPGFDVKGIL